MRVLNRARSTRDFGPRTSLDAYTLRQLVPAVALAGPLVSADPRDRYCASRSADGPAAFWVPTEVLAVLSAHCADCHGDRGKGNVDVTALDKLKLGNRLETLNKIQDQLVGDRADQFHQVGHGGLRASEAVPVADGTHRTGLFPARRRERAGHAKRHRHRVLGPQQPNDAFGSPKVAAQELFKSVSTDKNLHAQSQLGRTALAFAARREGQLAGAAPGSERAKVQGYADSLEAVRGRDRKVDAMADVIRPHVPKLDARHLANEMTTVDRQRGHVEVLLAALVSGLTNVVAFTVDELGHEYTGLPGLEAEKVNLHDVGHGKGFGKLTADEVRFAVRRPHMTLIDTIAARLKKAPEGDGTVFDNTMIVFFPDNGETHHSHGTEYPFVVRSGKNAKLNIRGRYIRLPNYGDAGHKTLGNWYTTLLNAHGNPVRHFGDPDPGLARFGIDQTGAIKQFFS